MTESYSDNFVAEYIQATQQRDSTESLPVPDVDVVFVVSSWEPRCTEVCKLANLTTSLGVHIQFSELGRSGGRDLHDAKLRIWLRNKTKHVYSIKNISATDEREWFLRIQHTLQRIYKKIGRPFSMLLDISCCPKPYILAILAYGFRNGLLRTAYLFYAQAEYSIDQTDAILGGVRTLKSYRFTEGEWRGVEIPYLEGDINAGKQRVLIAALGFEGWKSHQFVRNYDPDRTLVIMCNPGFNEEYTKVAENENKTLIKSLELREENVTKFAAGDMVSVFRFAYKNGREILETSALFFVGLGTKPHAVGLGLAGLVLEPVPVIARLPEQFVEKTSMPSGISWMYQVRDLSAL